MMNSDELMIELDEALKNGEIDWRNEGDSLVLIDVKTGRSAKIPLVEMPTEEQEKNLLERKLRRGTEDEY